MKQQSAMPEASINVTPLVDVVLVLLIIFMVVTPMIKDRVQLPRANDPATSPESSAQLTITINADHTVIVGSNIVRSDDLQAALDSAFHSRADRSVAIKADRSVAYGTVLEVMRACGHSGFDEVGLIAVKFPQRYVVV